MSEKKATRVAYGETLARLGDTYKNLVVLDSDLSGSTMSEMFAKKFPDRFFDCGIAEANMTSIAAGMAASGLMPFTNSFAMFAVGRAYEQIRNSIGYPHLNVKVVGSHGGISVGEDGATHQMIEDIALMRVIPGMTVVNPCDAYEMERAVEALVQYEGPAYLRLGRSAVETITDSIDGYEFKLGKGAVLKHGKDISIIATGMTVQMAMEAAEILSGKGVEATVIDLHTIKPLDEELLISTAKETGKILTVEEHSVVGGMGSAVAELLSEKYPVPVYRHGMYDEFGRSGSMSDVLKYFKLTGEAVADKALGILNA